MRKRPEINRFWSVPENAERTDIVFVIEQWARKGIAKYVQYNGQTKRRTIKIVKLERFFAQGPKQSLLNQVYVD